MVARAAAAGAAVVMSTHLLGVAERLCTRLLLMDRGRGVADLAGDALAELTRGGLSAIEDWYLARVAGDSK